MFELYIHACLSIFDIETRAQIEDLAVMSLPTPVDALGISLNCT